jgi:hypothetical protein
VFVSHNDGRTTSTIRVNVVQDLLVSSALFFVGLWLVDGSISRPIQHWVALTIGLLLLLAGFGLGQATLRLIFRGWRGYDDATRNGK